ncbi:hypothetical protein CWI43_02960 [Neisseria meningitidis]|nr:hypothetical protein CWI46_09775 [Neisseria meningitidis]PKU02307.1 hypothetical protein CWI43_02960 [Neisseria meningitidis]PKU10935.1 hypothetical protein CWI58_00585 [Neisseria meningitidis]
MIKIIILFIFNKFANAFFIFLGNTPKSRHSRAVVNPNASARKPISRHSHVYPVIPTYIPSFPRKWESGSFGFACFKFRVTSTSSFPRRRESSFLSFSHSR